MSGEEEFKQRFIHAQRRTQDVASAIFDFLQSENALKRPIFSVFAMCYRQGDIKCLFEITDRKHPFFAEFVDVFYRIKGAIFVPEHKHKLIFIAIKISGNVFGRVYGNFRFIAHTPEK